MTGAGVTSFIAKPSIELRGGNIVPVYGQREFCMLYKGRMPEVQEEEEIIVLTVHHIKPN